MGSNVGFWTGKLPLTSFFSADVFCISIRAEDTSKTWKCPKTHILSIDILLGNLRNQKKKVKFGVTAPSQPPGKNYSKNVKFINVKSIWGTLRHDSTRHLGPEYAYFFPSSLCMTSTSLSLSLSLVDAGSSALFMPSFHRDCHSVPIWFSRFGKYLGPIP